MLNEEEITVENSTENEAAPVKRTRKRVIKKDTSDHVYTVTGTEGENLDTKAAQKKAKAKTALFPEKKTTTRKKKAEKVEDAPVAFPKHRGRKSKAELEYLASLEKQALAEAELPFADDTVDMQEPQDEQQASAANEPETTAENTAIGNNETVDAADISDADSTPITNDAITDGNDITSDDNTSAGASETNSSEKQEGYEDIIPEEAFAIGADDDNADDGNLIAQLQARLNAQNENLPNGDDALQRNDPLAAAEEFAYWDGDPGDGTDFIIIEDIPIEDTHATMDVDIFDNPINLSSMENFSRKQPEDQRQQPAFNFDDVVTTVGLMEMTPDNYGFLRSSDYNYLSSPDDVFVSLQQIRKYGLKTGDVVECTVCPPNIGDKYFTLQNILKINGRNPQDIRDRVPFEHLTPLFPDEKFQLCANPQTTNMSVRIVDMFAPIGKGQRALIVAQPKTGKTILMKDIANAIAASHPEAYLMMLLIDERPEEVTDMARTVNAEVIASTFDEPAERHVKIAGLVLEKAKRMVECGHDVVIFLDSITRLARAYNTVAPASGKVLTGGVDANALQKPKRFFGAARNIEGGGSLTIIATALTDTGSKMDEVIFEEFKGTGNMELQLERALSNKRIFPAVNLVQSSTRRDDLLLDENVINRMWVLRNYISDMNSIEAMKELLDKMKGTRSNEEFLLSMNS